MDISMIMELHEQLRDINSKIRKELSYDVIDFNEVRRLMWHRNDRKKAIKRSRKMT
jgi:hypothetical protein